MYELLAVTQTLRGTLSSGDRGTAETLSLMRRLAADGSRDMTVRDTAIHVIAQSNAQPHDVLGQLRALFAFVRDRILFVGDIRGVETLQYPSKTLAVGAGDCDDRATLLVALARSVGIPADFKFRVIASNPNSPRSFSHVYAVARVGGKDIPMDPTYESNALGYEYPVRYRVGDTPA